MGIKKKVRPPTWWVRALQLWCWFPSCLRSFSPESIKYAQLNITNTQPLLEGISLIHWFIHTIAIAYGSTNTLFTLKCLFLYQHYMWWWNKKICFCCVSISTLYKTTGDEDNLDTLFVYTQSGICWIMQIMKYKNKVWNSAWRHNDHWGETEPKNHNTAVQLSSSFCFCFLFPVGDWLSCMSLGNKISKRDSSGA